MRNRHRAGQPTRQLLTGIAGTMTQGLHIQVNGESRATATGATVADLLRELDIRPDRVAVELNLEILDKREFDRRSLQEGDRVEIISFIGGGME